MAIIAGKIPHLLLVSCVAMMISGCGLKQKVSDGTAAMTQSIFYKQVKMLHLDIRAREALNNNARGEALSTVVRIYQLKERKTFDATDYTSLFADDSQALKEDLVARQDVYLQPGAAVMVNMPMEENVRYVAVAGMFMSPDLSNDSWRGVITRAELDPDNARVIEASDNRLQLLPLKS